MAFSFVVPPPLTVRRIVPSMVGPQRAPFTRLASHHPPAWVPHHPLVVCGEGQKDRRTAPSMVGAGRAAASPLNPPGVGLSRI
jgi:hypothetical protein